MAATRSPGEGGTYRPTFLPSGIVYERSRLVDQLRDTDRRKDEFPATLDLRDRRSGAERPSKSELS